MPQSCKTVTICKTAAVFLLQIEYNYNDIGNFRIWHHCTKNTSYFLKKTRSFLLSVVYFSQQTEYNEIIHTNRFSCVFAYFGVWQKYHYISGGGF